MTLASNTKTRQSRRKSKYAEILTRPIAFHRVYATIAGSACAGLFLSQAMYWDSITENPEGWFYKTYEQWTSETALNRYELDKIRHHLTSINILQTQLKGSPAQLHYRINHEILDSFLDVVQKSSFTSVRPKNKHPRKHSKTSEFVDRQQTDSVCSPLTISTADGQQTSLQTINKLVCRPSTNFLYTEITTENTTKTTTEREDPPTPKVELNSCDENSSLTPQPQHEVLQQQAPSTQNEEPEQPTPQRPTLLLKKSESSHQTDNSSSGQIVAASFDNYEQTNIVDFPKMADFELSSGEIAKLQKYQQLEADGIKLKQPELRDWAALEIAPYVRTYRKSGFILTGGNDVSSEFAVYVAKQNCRKGQEPTIALGFNVINKCETDPRHWQKLVAWVVEWQQQRHTGQTVNVAGTVTQQQQLDRIRLAANTKFEL
jgi:hypothetical protein